MSHRCFATEDLAAVAVLPPADPRRREAEACPRCAGLLAAVTAFLAGDPQLPAAEREQAERRLAAASAARIGAPAGGSARWPRAAAPRWRLGTGLALATAAGVAMVALLSPDAPVPGGPSGTVRGGGQVGGPAPIAEVAVADTLGPGLPAGSLRLTWPPVAGADRYEIVVIGADLDTLGTLGPWPGPPGVVAAGLLEAAPDGAFARVRALAGGAAVAESRLVPLPAR